MSAFRVVLALVLLACALPAMAQERILDYRVEVEIRSDASIDVTEHIRVRAEGQRLRRGIYRDFPTRYRDRYGNAVVVDLQVLGVERDGRPEHWFTEAMDNGVRINTGGDDLLPGLPREFEFSLRYRTTRQLGFFEAHDELYWNAIGTGWDFAIERGSVEVRLPAMVDPASMRLDAYTGVQGAQGGNAHGEVVSPGLARWRLTAPLGPREGLTIALGFPKGLVVESTRAERLGWLLKDNRGLLVALATLGVLLAWCVWRWRAVGRDPAPGVIIARYQPPVGRSPAELRYLKRMGYDPRCLTADLLAGAVAGAAEIERQKGLLFGSTWSLSRGAGAVEDLPQTVRSLISKLLPPGLARLELKRSSATAQHMQAAMQAHTRALHQRLHRSHFNNNSADTILAVAIAVCGAVIAFLSAEGSGEPAIIAVCVLMLGVVIAFARLVQAPTAQGRKLLDEIEGLKLYMRVAERDELAAVPGPGQPPSLDAERYEALLPYAIALDVEEAWTAKFTAAVGAAAAAAATESIRWYRGGGFNDIGSLAKAVGTGLNSSIASASSPPGSSSGGGGGGSSGGGGGGGGGGGR